MPLRGIRGATVAAADSSAAITTATLELLRALSLANQLAPADIASVFFTTTPDLTAAYPARAARELGWTDTALMCLSEMPVPNSLPYCIRVLIHWNTHKTQDEVKHIYLGAAVALRPDRATNS